MIFTSTTFKQALIKMILNFYIPNFLTRLPNYILPFTELNSSVTSHHIIPLPLSPYIPITLFLIFFEVPFTIGIFIQERWLYSLPLFLSRSINSLSINFPVVPFPRMTESDIKGHLTIIAKYEHFSNIINTVPYDMLVLDKMTK